jgi:hypothetical protein
MLHFRSEMPVVFIIASDRQLRTAVRAELRERGVDAMGMESADDAGAAIARGEMPAAIVLEGDTRVASGLAIRTLVERVPTVLIASRIEKVDLPPLASVFYRPVLIAQVVQRVEELLRQPRLA